jgi:hypothetical protein
MAACLKVELLLTTGTALRTPALKKVDSIAALKLGHLEATDRNMLKKF